MQPNVSDNGGGGDGKTPLFRQSFMTFGDKSWGSIKLGKDLGIFAADAILNDMTLLGVGSPAAGVNGAATTYGGIGTGYIYAAWKGQIAYTTPNMNGFQATVGVTNPNQIENTVNSVVSVDEEGVNTTTTTTASQSRLGLEGKASYSFAANDVTGKVWVSGASYRVRLPAALSGQSYNAYAGDIGANINLAGFGLTGYYYAGEGAGTTVMGRGGYDFTNARKRDSDGGYVQATYTLPIKTKIGIAYGKSNLDKSGAGDDDSGDGVLTRSNERWTIGAYHPLTKHLNLVAEYSNTTAKSHTGGENENGVGSLGAILFF
jgi:hypothetical protein